jgi:hypothetical protein
MVFPSPGHSQRLATGTLKQLGAQAIVG